MNLENYISQLLYRYQCVMVPGFGAFLTEIQSAQHIAQTNSFSPPKKTISFNPLVKNNDGLLANHIVKTERIAYDSAVNYINFEVENWNAKLEEFGQFSIKNVGDFYLNKDKNVVFEPFVQHNYLTNSFGLNSFISPSIKRIFEEKVEIFETEKKEQESQVVDFIPNKIERRESIPFLKYAAVLLLSGGLGIAGANKLYNNNIEAQELAINQKVQGLINNKIQTATFFISNPLRKVVKSNTADTSLNYHIVAGVFKNVDNAKKEIEKLSELGYNPTMLAQTINGYPVIYKSFSSFAEAKKAELEIEKTQNPDAWVLTQVLK